MKKIGWVLLMLLLLVGMVACSNDEEGGDRTITISIGESAKVGEEVFLDKSASFEPFYQDNIKYEVVGENTARVKFNHRLNDRHWFDTYVTAGAPGTVSIKLSYIENGKVVAESNTVTITFTAEQIGTVEELKGLNGKDGAYQLNADIDLDGAVWSSIEFGGYLDGAGHKISNFTLNANADNLGFFSTLTGEVYDIHFENVTVTAMSNKSGIGIVAGTNQGTIGDVTVSGTVNAKYATRVGGIAGKSTDRSLIEGCKNLAEITAGDYTGGIVGECRGEVASCINEGAVSGKSYVGGIVGDAYGTASGVENKAKITADGDYLGGLFGRTCATIENSKNMGDVESRGDYVGGVAGYSTGSSSGDNNVAAVTGRYYVGGFFGYTSGNLTLYKNTATITGRAYVGGIVGKCGGKLTGCENHGEVISTGTVTEDGKPHSYLGGLAGYCKGIEDGKNTVNLTATGNRVGGLAGYCEGDLKGSINEGTVSGASAVGGLVGRLYGSLMTSTNSGNVTGAGAEVGGLAGSMSGAKIEICQNNGTVSGKDDTGGLVGELSSNCEIIAVESLADVTGVYGVGGYVGYLTSTVTITGAINNNTVSGTAFVGGIIGQGYATKLVDCENYGSVLASGFFTENSEARTYVGGLAGKCGAISGGKSVVDIVATDHYVGGLAGWATGNISNSECNGNVSGKNYVGGLVGRIDASIVESISSGNVTGENYVAGLAGFINAGKVEYSKNQGSVMGQQYVGGLVGWSNVAIEITSCENLGDISGNADIGTMIGRSASRVTIRNSLNYGGQSAYYRFVGTYSNSYVPNALPYIDMAGRLDIKVSDTVSAMLLGIAATDIPSGNELTVTVSIYSGAQVAGEEMVITASIVDEYGNTDVRYFTVKVHATPDLQYNCNSISREEYLSIDGKGVTVTFDLNGGEGSLAPQTVTETVGLVYPAAPTREGYVFRGWYLDAACTGKPYDFTTDIVRSFTLYAGWYQPTTSGYGNFALDIVTANNNVSGSYSFSTKGTSLFDKYRYDYFSIPADGTYTIYYKNGSNDYSYGTHVAIYNQTTGAGVLAKTMARSTTYSSVTFTAKAGDIICVSSYRNSSNISEKYYTNFYFYVTGPNTALTPKTLLPDYVENALLNPVATDSFGKTLSVRTTLKSGEITVGGTVVYTLTVTDAAGNVTTIDTDPIPVTD
ncbi:MAG: InlB B-repeat-containing protein [Clostridia bacterium]|nr:InlB B-repeat-containing protein [Clostridia bacterium]